MPAGKIDDDLQYCQAQKLQTRLNQSFTNWIFEQISNGIVTQKLPDIGKRNHLDIQDKIRRQVPDIIY